MGVPKFYRFVSERYPLINTPLRPSSAPQIDNLYLDMNGIIHNCVRTIPGNGGLETNRYSTSVPATTKSHPQIFLDVFKYIDNLLSLITPSRVLFMAIDGVAPRAKMNQQRARRFRSAKERLDEHKRMTEENPMYAAAEVEPFDSNCITPGTHFMYKLTEALKYFVAKKLTEDVNWADLQVILSGAEAPGEGEHKIMAYIRSMRESGQLPANTRHCVYGLDADLILLGLVTHEPHFFILREKVDFNSWRKKGGPRVATALDTTVFGEFELLSIGLLREYLVLELGADGNCGLPYFDVERIADDFVFIIMLIGNDFLPNLPTLDIADGTLHVMLHLYKRALPLIGGYLTNEGKIDGDRLEYFFAKLGLLEEDVLRQRLEEESSGSGRRNRRGTRGKTFANVDLDQLFGMTTCKECPKQLSLEELHTESLLSREKVNRIESLKNEYYAQKFGPDFVQDSSLERVTKAYLEGIAWTLKYYTEGCRQWRWYYPEHYAPLASDVSGAVETLKRYEEGILADKPFRPFEQLMSVLPPVSSWCLPSPYQMLMKSPTSPIRDQYPEDFQTDLNGKRNDWEAVVLLPFVAEDRLLEALHDIPLEALSPEEAARNECGPSYLYRRDINSKEIMESPFGMFMPSFVHQTKRKNLILPSIDPGKPFTAALLPGTKSAKSGKGLADLPTLNEVEHGSRLEAIGVNVFGTPSKSESLVLVIDFDVDDDKEITAESNSTNQRPASILDQRGVTVGSAVWCGYPWRVAASVESITNEFVTKRVLPASQAKSDHAEAPLIEARKAIKENFARDVKVVTSGLLQKCAVSISSPKQVVTVRQVGHSIWQSASKNNETSLCHEHLLTLRSRDEGEGADAEGRTRQLARGQSLLYVGHGCYFGHRGSVVSQGANGLVRIQFDKSSAAAKEPAFGYRVVSVCGSQERWMPLSKFAATVGMKVPLADQYLGSLRVRLSSGKDEVDLGLGVKYIGRRLYIPGYARPDDRSHFLFSRKCADLLYRYSKAFPTLFSSVEKLKTGERNGGRTRGVVIFEARDLFPDVKKPDEAVKAVSTWLSMQDVASLPLVSAKADILTREVVFELEKHCSIVLALQREFDEVSRKTNRVGVVKDVDQGSLLTGHEPLEWDIEGRTTPAAIYHAPVKSDASDLRLGDRVVNRLGSGGVPFGLRGTVIGLHPPELPEDSDEDESYASKRSHALVEVCFDEGFIGGGSLGSRCSKGRGKVVPASSLVIVRPDRDNTFYVKNYARVAALVGLAPKQNSDKGDNSLEKNAVIASAAVKSYAAAVKQHSLSISTVPVAAVRSTADEKDLSVASSFRGTACRSTAEGSRAVVDIHLSAKPENLPLPSFLRSRPPSHVGVKPETRLDVNVQTRPERQAQREGTKSNMNGDIPSDASLIGEMLKGALERGEVRDDRGKGIATMSCSNLGGSLRVDRYGSAVEPQAEPTDEDEFAAIWRKLQVGSESATSGRPK